MIAVAFRRPSTVTSAPPTHLPPPHAFLCTDDIEWLREKLPTDLADEEARSLFRELVFKCMRTTYTKVDQLAHLFKHA